MNLNLKHIPLVWILLSISACGGGSSKSNSAVPRAASEQNPTPPSQQESKENEEEKPLPPEAPTTSIADNFFNLFNNTIWGGTEPDIQVPEDAYGGLTVSIHSVISKPNGYEFQLISRCSPFQMESENSGAYLFMDHSGKIELRCSYKSYVVGQATNDGLEIKNFSGGRCDGTDSGFVNIKLIGNNKVSSYTTYKTWEGDRKSCIGNLTKEPNN